MRRYLSISLIDSGDASRARHAKELACTRFDVHSYTDVETFKRKGDTHTLILVSDQGSALTMLLADMRARDYWAPVLAYGRLVDPVRCSQLILQGLVGYLPAPFASHELEALLDGAADQLTAIIDLRCGAAYARQRLRGLTPRETEVLERLQAGLTNRQIADNLEISPRTVEIHRANMLRKMNTKTSVGAVRMCMHAKIAV